MVSINAQRKNESFAGDSGRGSAAHQDRGSGLGLQSDLKLTVRFQRYAALQQVLMHRGRA